jgi:hypothetical protein
MDTLPDSDSEGIKKINWRQFGRRWIVVFILAALAAFVIWGLLKSGPWLKKFQDWRLARQLEAPYRNDKYGGETPEETFDMFIAALEKGDVELASKYFKLDKQESWRQSLVAIKNQPDAFNEMLVEMKFARNNANRKIEDHFAWFSYTPPGSEYGTDIVFEVIFGKWKISHL